VYSEVEELAHTKSAKKMIHVIGRQRRHNRGITRAVKTSIGRAEELISGKELEQAKEAVRQASVALDKAAKKGVIHPNNAARHKSRLMKKYNVAFPPAKA
jgi:small subunit ribosomal protein S20